MNASSIIAKTISTFFYIGYLPLIPGTFGSLAGVILFLMVKDNTAAYLLVTFILIILGFIYSGQTEKILNKKDARCIVIDEVSGMLVSFLFLPYDFKILVLGFLVFRLLDTLKPFPAACFERLKGSAGIMSDDLVAGIYTNIVLQVALRLVSFKAS